MRLAVVTPVFNDWTSLSRLTDELESISLPQNVSLSLFAVDDGSNERGVLASRQFRRIESIEIITLASNLGHQRAIAVGLVEVYRRDEFDAVVVMDSDGEDSPSDIPRLLNELTIHPGHVICAKRGRRPGLLAFRLWYECYKYLFQLLTGARIDFGNFCIIPKEMLGALVRNSSTWNNLAGALTRSRLPLFRLPSDRGRRYAGKSKMNFVALIIHGLGAMAVFSDVVMVRLLLASATVTTLTALGIVLVFLIKIFTDLAIPGWATNAAGILVIIMVQASMIFTIAAFNVMSLRSVNSVIPLSDAGGLVLSRRKVLSVETMERAG